MHTSKQKIILGITFVIALALVCAVVIYGQVVWKQVQEQNSNNQNVLPVEATDYPEDIPSDVDVLTTEERLEALEGLTTPTLEEVSRDERAERLQGLQVGIPTDQE